MSRSRSTHECNQEKSILLSLRSISVQRKEVLILDNVTFSVTQGEIVTLIGPNGAGKSTLIKVSLGLVKQSSGSVYRNTAMNIGYVPQTIDIDWSLPISVNRFLKLSRNYGQKDILDTLKRLDVDYLIQTPMQKVSGGEMRRILLARALLRKPNLLILDEPTAGVDISCQSNIYLLIQQIRDKNQCGILLVSHDLHVVMAATDRVICLNHHICCTGEPEKVQNHPNFIKLFGNSSQFKIYPHYHDHTHGLNGEIDQCSDSSNHALR